MWSREIVFLKSLYLNVFVTLIVNKSSTVVYVEVCNKNGTIESDEEIFKTTAVDNKMYNYIMSYTKESPFFYIAILDTSSNQGSIPTSSEDKVSNFIDKISSSYRSYNDSWSYYTSKYDIKELQSKYSKIGIDLIFSPFVVLSQFFKDKIDTHMAMFILIEDNYLSLSVFDTSKLLYSVHLDMENETESEELMIDEDDIELDLEEDSIDIDNIDVLDDMDSLDDFGDIEDLDSIDDIDEFSDARDIEEELTEEAEEGNMPIYEGDGFTEDYHRYTLIKGAVNNFYQDETFDSQFIETVYIADGVGVSADLKTYLEDEMFFSVYIRQIHLSAEVCELAKMEI